MRYPLVVGLACAAFVAGLTAVAAQQPASAAPKPKPKPKPTGPTPAQALTVVNASGNTALDVIIEGENQSARLGKPLAPKAQASLKLPKLKGCTVSVVGMFQGGGKVEVEEFDVCKEKLIRFTE